MLACVCQPAETKLYKGGRATPLGPLGGPQRPLQRPRSLKSRPPKPPPKPHSYSTASDDTRSSSSQQKSPKIILRRIEQRAKTTKIPSISSAASSKGENQDDGSYKIGQKPPQNGVVTITDNDGKIYCVDNLILVAEEVLSKIKNEYSDSGDESSKKCPSSADKLTVKQKTDDESEGRTPRADGTNVCEVQN